MPQSTRSHTATNNNYQPDRFLPPHWQAGRQQRPRAGRCRARIAPPGNPHYGRSPPANTSTTITMTMDDCGEVPDRAAVRFREQQGAGVLHPSHTLPPWAAGTTTTRTEPPAACRPPATGPSRRQRCAGCRRRCSRRVGGGGGEERLPELLAGVRSTMIGTRR